MDCIDYPCDYLKLNYTDSNLALVEIQLQNTPKDTWDALHQETNTIDESAANSLTTSEESEYFILGSLTNTIGKELYRNSVCRHVWITFWFIYNEFSTSLFKQRISV